MTTSIALDFALPPLREDLKLLEGPAAQDGSPTWNIYDSIRNRYFRIGWIAFELLSRWSMGTATELIRDVKKNTTCVINPKDVEKLVQFLYENSLTRDPPGSTSKDYYEQYESSEKNWLLWLLHNYLFIRLPLVRPHRFLKASLPFVQPFYGITARSLVTVLGVIGLFLVLREWDEFINSFQYFFNFNGFLAFAAAVVFIKILHELGHAYLMTHFGGRVPTMGIAFLVMLPVLYTDTSDAWRLKSRRERLLIGAGGILTEVYIAMICTFLWCFLPDGVFRSAAFVLATTSWVMSLAINLNGFLRFDGYYLLTDWLGIENLQERTFNLGKWKLREWLFNLGLPAPYQYPLKKRRWLIAYAWCSWVYRFFLFIGIAVLVYLFFFKLLGIILFLVEILWFIMFPIMRELKVWWGLREQIIISPRAWFNFCLLCLFVVLFLIPWNTNVRIPAIVESDLQSTVYAPAPGRIQSIMVGEGDAVVKGQTLMVLTSKEIDDELNKTEVRIEAVRLRAKRIAASAEELTNMQVILQELEELKSRRNSLIELRQQLTILAPISGTVRELSRELHSGRWINESLQLMHIVEPENSIIKGLIPERELSRLSINQSAVFYPDEPERAPINARVLEIDSVNTSVIQSPYFLSTFGGDVAVRQDKDGRYVPESAMFRVRLLPQEARFNPSRVIPGVVHITGESRSLASQMKERVMAILIRESGF